jgi:hypothetical protein
MIIETYIVIAAIGALAVALLGTRVNTRPAGNATALAKAA